MGIVKSPEACEDRKERRLFLFQWQVDLKYRHWYRNEVIVKSQRAQKSEAEGALEMVHSDLRRLKGKITCPKSHSTLAAKAGLDLGLWALWCCFVSCGVPDPFSRATYKC